MNQVFLIGNLTRDPELTETAGGISVCRFSIAVSRKYQNSDGERETDFFNCQAWRGLAESIARYLKKGNKVAVTGSLQNRSYEKDGEKRTVTEIQITDAEFLTPKQTESEEAPRSSASRTEQGNKQSSVFDNYGAKNKRTQLEAFDDDSDIPF